MVKNGYEALTSPGMILQVRWYHLIGLLRVPRWVIPLIFPNVPCSVPQSSQTESLGFPRNSPSAPLISGKSRLMKYYNLARLNKFWIGQIKYRSAGKRIRKLEIDEATNKICVGFDSCQVVCEKCLKHQRVWLHLPILVEIETLPVLMAVLFYATRGFVFGEHQSDDL